MYNSSILLSVSSQARSLCSQRASDKHRFFVGTCSLHDPNELSLLQYSEDAHHLETISTFNHTDHVMAIESSPRDDQLVVTSRLAVNGDQAVTIWRLGDLSALTRQEDIGYNDEVSNLELSDVVSFNQSKGPSQPVGSLKWHKSKESILMSDSKSASVWNIDEGRVGCEGLFPLNDSSSADVYSGGSLFPGSVSWDPHCPHNFSMSSNNHLSIMDLRKSGASQIRKDAHSGAIRDVDFNPNKPLLLLTAGNDRKIRFWDLRTLKLPVKVLDGHSHWVTAARFNPFHDQLVLSGGSDHVVNLWRIASCSSSPW